jgi:hypothetical protein
MAEAWQLRKLIQDAEWGSEEGVSCCPWCGAGKFTPKVHAASCEAAKEMLWARQCSHPMTKDIAVARPDGGYWVPCAVCGKPV